MRFVFVLAVAAVLATGAQAQSEKDHTAHHPEGASAPAAAAQMIGKRMDMMEMMMQMMMDREAARAPAGK